MTPYDLIPKSLAERLQDLTESMLVMRDAIRLVRQGSSHQLIPLYGQLRSLLCEKSKGNKPLLVSLAAEFGRPLCVYCMAGVDDPAAVEALHPNTIFLMVGLPVSLQRVLPAQQEIDLEAFLDLDLIRYHSRQYSVRALIEFFANKAGGAHFAPSLPRDFAEMLLPGFVAGQVLRSALLQVAEATYQLALRLMRQLCEIEFLFTVVASPPADGQRAFLFDLTHPETPMRMFCTFEPNKQLCFGLRSLYGQTVEVRSAEWIDWSEPKLVSLQVVFDDDLQTHLALSINGRTVGRTQIPFPVFVSADLTSYDFLQNRSHEEGSTGANMGLGALMVFERLSERSAVGYAQAIAQLEAMRRDPNAGYVWYEAGSFGRAPPGTQDLTMTGHVHKGPRTTAT